jgi:hypothetical protein
LTGVPQNRRLRRGCGLFPSRLKRSFGGPDFDSIDLFTRSIIAIPALSPEYVIEDLGDLDLIRIAPNWPANSA